MVVGGTAGYMHGTAGYMVVAYSILVSAPVPFSFSLKLKLLDLIGTWFGFGQGGLGTKGLGTGLDNSAFTPGFVCVFQTFQTQLDNNLFPINVEFQ